MDPVKQICWVCLQKNEWKREKLSSIINEAKKQAFERGETIAIYKSGSGWDFCEYSIAIEQRYAITEVISQYLYASPSKVY